MGGLKNVPPKGNSPQGLSDAQRADLRTNIDLQRALDHIDRIYTDKILNLYGLGLVIGLVSDDFDNFMDLRPRGRLEAGTSFADLFIGIFKAFSIFTPFEEVFLLGRAATVAEGFVASKRGIIPSDSDGFEPDEGTVKYLEGNKLKIPFYQNILARRYELEYERIDKRKQFMDDLYNSLGDPKFKGTPMSLVIEKFGAAPERPDRERVYANFIKEENNILKALLKAYVRANVKISLFRKQTLPRANYLETYVIFSGLNEAQWRALYGRYGTQPSVSERRLAQRFTYKDYKKLSAINEVITKSILPFLPDPTITGVKDLWLLWGAKLLISSQTWYGRNEEFLRAE